MTISTPTPVQDVYAKWEHDFKATEADTRSKTINLIAKIALCALIATILAAGVVIAFLAAPITVLLGIALVTGAVGLATLATVFLIQNPSLAYMQARDQLGDYRFRDLIRLDDTQYTERKVALFQKYGVHCKKLDLTEDTKSQIGIPVKAFLDWRLVNIYQYGRPYHQKTIDFLKTIPNSNIYKGSIELSLKINTVINSLNIGNRHVEHLKRFPLQPNETQLSRDKAIEDQLSECQNAEQEILKQLTTESSISISKSHHIAAIIRSCPNVKELDLNRFLEFTDIQQACRDIGVRPKELHDAFRHISIKRDFDNIKI